MDVKLIAMAAHLVTDVHLGPTNCLDVRVTLPPLDDADRTTLRNAAEALFWEMPPIAREERGKSKRVLQSTATQLARRMKSTKDLQGAMRELFCRRRKFMSDDRKPLHNADFRATIWKEWCEDFIRDELNDEQRNYKRVRQTSIFTT